MIRIAQLVGLSHAKPAAPAARAPTATGAKFVAPPRPGSATPATSGTTPPHLLATPAKGSKVQPSSDAPSERATPAKKVSRRRDDDDELDLDRSVRAVAAMIPPTASLSPIASPKAEPASPFASIAQAEEVQAIANALVEKASFWGDGTRGVARLRFGSGARGLSGATATLESDGERIVLRLEGADDATAARLAEKLAALGVELA